VSGGFSGSNSSASPNCLLCRSDARRVESFS
jgi:hypothetical protein